MTADRREWFVVRTKARKEEFACRNLERRSVTAFCPRILEPVGWADEWAVMPLFPGYLFVEISLESEYHRVIWTPGVKSFVAFGETPASVQEEVVAFLRRETEEDGVIRPTSRFRKGQRVRIRRGPFAGLVAIIETPSPERGRIRVLMDFLRQQTTVELPIAAIGRL